MKISDDGWRVFFLNHDANRNTTPDPKHAKNTHDHPSSLPKQLGNEISRMLLEESLRSPVLESSSSSFIHRFLGVPDRLPRRGPQETGEDDRIWMRTHTGNLEHTFKDTNVEQRLPTLLNGVEKKET